MCFWILSKKRDFLWERPFQTSNRRFLGASLGKHKNPNSFSSHPKKLTFTLGKKEENGRFPHGITIPTRRGRPARTTSPARIPGETKSWELNPTLEPFILPPPGAFCFLCPLGSAQGLKGIPGKVLEQDPAFLTLLCPHPGEERGDPGRGLAPWQLLPGDIGDVRSLPGDTDPIPDLIPPGNRALGGFNLDNSGSIQGKGGQGSSRAWDGSLRAFSPGVGWD